LVALTQFCAEFESALDASPCDWGLRLVYADWLLENGHEDEAEFQRFLAGNQLAPRYHPEPIHKTPWIWLSERSLGHELHKPIGPDLQSGLREIETRELMETAEGRYDESGGPAWYATRQRAEADLFRARVAAGRPAEPV
jgi:uncharacterized protein (TIGR02996 family)